MEKAKRRIIRHVLAGICLLLALLGAAIPIFQGWIFFLLAVILLAIDYRWIRNVALRPLYRRFPRAYRRMTVWRRRTKVRLGHRFKCLGHKHPHPHGDKIHASGESESSETE